MTLQQTFFRLFLACLTCVSLSCAAKDCYASEEKELAYVESTYSKSSYNIRGSKAVINKAEVNMDRFVSRDISQGTTGRITIASVNNHIQEVGGGEFSEDKNGAGVHIKEQMYEESRISDKDRIMVASMWGDLKAEISNDTDKSSTSGSYDAQESAKLSFEETGLTKRKYQERLSGKNPYRDSKPRRDKNDIHGAVPEPMPREERIEREKKFEARRRKTKINKERMGGTLGQTVVGTFGDILLKIKDLITLEFSVEERFDDNIFETWDIHKEHDFITTLTPTITFSIDRDSFDGILFRGRGGNRNRNWGGNNRNQGSGRNNQGGNFGRNNQNRNLRGKSDVTFPELTISLSSDIEYYLLHPKLNNQGDEDSFFQPKLLVELYPDEDLRLFYDLDFQRRNITQIDPLGDNQRQEKVNTTTTRYGFDYDLGNRKGEGTSLSGFGGGVYGNNRGRGFSNNRTNRAGGFNRGGQFGGYGGGGSVARLSYEHTSTDNKGENELDNTTDKWSLEVNINNPPSYLPKIFLEYEGESSDLGSNSNQKKVTHDFFVGLRGNFSPKIDGTVKGGYGFAFPSASNVFSFKDPYGSFVTELDLNYYISPRVDIGVKFDRSLGNVASFAIDEDSANIATTGSGITNTLNVPRQTRDEWEAALELRYIPPFFSENLTLTADYSHREITYSDRSSQKVREIGLKYTYVWDNKNRYLGGSNRNRNFGWNNQNQNRNFRGNNQNGNFRGRARRTVSQSGKYPIMWGSEWEFEGEVRTRKTSPEESWSRFSNNEISLKLTTEF